MTKQTQNVTLSPTQAVILLIGASEVEKCLYKPTQLGDISIKDQRDYLKRFCQRRGYEILETIEVSEDGKEFQKLADRLLKDENQDIVLVSENFGRLARKSKVFLPFKKAFQKPLKEEKIDLVSAQNELFVETPRNAIREMAELLQIVVYLVEGK